MPSNDVDRRTVITNACRGKKLSELDTEALRVIGILRHDGKHVSGGEIHTACSCVGVEDNRTDEAKRKNLWEFPKG